MKSDPITLLISLGAGIFFGMCYSLVKVPSPAPPLFALFGLFGILIGSAIIPTIQTHFASPHFHAAKRSAQSNGQHSLLVTVRRSGDDSTTPPKPPTTGTKF